MHVQRSLTSLAAAAAFCFGCCGSAFASTSGLVISQVYGGGGNSGATYKNDFIELFNAGTAPVSLAGYSVQYASATGAVWQVTNLSGSVAPGHYFLIQQSAGAAGTVNLPTPDVIGTIPMSSSTAKVALVASTTPLAVAAPGAAAVVDLVGYGATNGYEGSGPASAPEQHVGRFPRRRRLQRHRQQQRRLQRCGAGAAQLGHRRGRLQRHRRAARRPDARRRTHPRHPGRSPPLAARRPQGRRRAGLRHRRREQRLLPRRPRCPTTTPPRPRRCSSTPRRRRP